jgi:small-conductance mechanosensitive channel
MLYSPVESPMSSTVPFLTASTLSIVLHLLGIFVVALFVNRSLHAATNLLIKPAAGQGRAEQLREQQTRLVAQSIYSVASRVIWAVAILTAFDQFGISPVPALIVLAVAGVAASLGAQHVIRDVIAGFYILREDQFAAGDTVQIADHHGKIEQLTLRRTVLRDPRGALVTIANGDIRSVANLSRDWSQSFVDVGLAPEISLEKPMAALEAAAAELRSDASWSQALVDGPRVLGVQSYDRNATVVRLQVRTAPTRQDEVTRELRRRIQIEFQKQGIPLASVARFELTNSQPLPGGTPQSASPQ